MHTTLEFYISRYNGSNFTGADSVSFEHYCIMASSVLDQFTFDRIKEDTEKVQFCTCELIDCMLAQVEEDNNNYQSESLGNHSVTYRKSTEQEKGIKHKSIIRRWLGNSGLMYAGLNVV